ncbi:hypothetical protein RhiirC2_801935 [Rhizophagus irregularis]|uniref:Uncharacterized protein n=1 Tax=Rhizophagus irregularis TaxID=588596 RepID=A0A2N1M1W0_9GLOM|nr:hypothetical protein RhiirC2_801935 [Rhizophagus irregularis]
MPALQKHHALGNLMLPVQKQVHDYPDQLILYKKDLYNAVYQFRQKNNSEDTDASQMLELLMQ